MARDPSGHTALTVACVNGYAKCVSLLLQRGAELVDAEAKGFTPLMYCAWQGRADCAELLLRAGASASRRTSAGTGGAGTMTALELSLQHGHADVAALLGHREGGGMSPAAAHSSPRQAQYHQVEEGVPPMSASPQAAGGLASRW